MHSKRFSSASLSTEYFQPLSLKTRLILWYEPFVILLLYLLTAIACTLFIKRFTTMSTFTQDIEYYTKFARASIHLSAMNIRSFEGKANKCLAYNYTKIILFIYPNITVEHLNRVYTSNRFHIPV